MTVALVMVVAVLTAADRARAYVYLADKATNAIDRVTLDGQHIEYGFIQGASNPGQVVVDSMHLYWLNRGDGAIGRANIDGTGANPDWISGAFGTGEGLAIDGGHVYWTNIESAGAYIGRANLDGSGANPQWLTGVSDLNGDQSLPDGVAVDAANIYYTSASPNLAFGVDDYIGRANLDGTGQDNTYIDITTSSQSGPAGQLVTIDGSLYWGFGTSVGRASVDGSYLDTAFGTSGGGTAGPAVDGLHVYWAENADYPDLGTSLFRANLDGTGFLHPFVQTTAQIQGIAADELVPPAAGWTLGGPPGSPGPGGPGAARPPTSRVSLPGSPLKLVGHVVSIRLRCIRARCRGTASLAWAGRGVGRHRRSRLPLTLGRARYAAAAGHTITVKLRLTSAALTALSKSRAARVWVTATASDAGAATALRKLLLSLSRRLSRGPSSRSS